MKNLARRELRRAYRVVAHDRNAKVFYGECGEDALLQEYFPGDYRGFYIDIGAYHPYRWSNTALFNQQNWRGMNIDVQTGAIVR